MSRTSHRWQSLPGSFDVLHAGNQFPSSNTFGIPDMLPPSLTRIPDWLVPYRQRIRAHMALTDGAVHFFMDDYRFETVWNRPRKALEALRPFTTILSPDFSIYRNWPLTLQLWNTYRNRWCGRFWQEQGYHVIPTVSWSTYQSYDFCFLGIPSGVVVAISSVGVNLKDPLEAILFRDGFLAMLQQVKPRLVLCYGQLPPSYYALVEIRSYPTRWTNIRAARAESITDGTPASMKAKLSTDTSTKE